MKIADFRRQINEGLAAQGYKAQWRPDGVRDAEGERQQLKAAQKAREAAHRDVAEMVHDGNEWRQRRASGQLVGVFEGLAKGSAPDSLTVPPIPSREECYLRNPPYETVGRSMAISPRDRSGGAPEAPCDDAPQVAKIVGKPIRERMYWIRSQLRRGTVEIPRARVLRENMAWLRDRLRAGRLVFGATPRRGRLEPPGRKIVHLLAPRVAACGWAPTSPAGVSVIVGDSGVARLGGVQHCGNLHACPVCAMSIKGKRAEEIREVVEQHGVERCSLLTLTVRHGPASVLKKMRAGLSDAWRATCRGAPWRRFKERIGWVGQIRAQEVTHGPNGWHPHYHILLLHAEQMTERQRQEAEDFIADRWATMVERYMGIEFLPDPTHGVDLRLVHDGGYIQKLGLEVSDPGTKKARRPSHRNQWQIAHGYATTGSPRDGRLWLEYTEGMKGSRGLTWSRGLKARFGIRDRSDEELAEDEELEPTAAIVGVIELALWEYIRSEPGADSYLLTETENGGGPALKRALRRMRERLEAAS